MAARSKRFAGLDMASLNAEKAKEMKDQPLPIPDLQNKAMEASGTGVLHWENMQLHRLPMAKELSIPATIHTLKIYNNSLHEFPSEVMSLRRLESLEVNANMLTSIPADITRLETLRSLHLHHNHIQKLPPEVGGLTNLTSLRVHGNRLKELPLEISYCTNLTELSVQDNPMHKPFVDCHEVPLHDLMTALGHLRLCQERKELHLVPMCVSWLKASAIEHAHRLSSVLTSLYAPHNDMTELTDLIGDFTKLGVLTLFSCGIAKVSPRVSEIKEATHIDLRSNNLSVLPPVLDLPKLTTLLLDDNKFEEFPNCVLTCPALEYLSLRNNQSRFHNSAAFNFSCLVKIFPHPSQHGSSTPATASQQINDHGHLLFESHAVAPLFIFLVPLSSRTSLTLPLCPLPLCPLSPRSRHGAD